MGLLLTGTTANAEIEDPEAKNGGYQINVSNRLSRSGDDRV